MLYNVAQLLKEGIGAVRQYRLVGDLHAVDENNPGPVHVDGHVRLLRTVRGVLVTGQAHAKATQICRRCLESAQAEFDFEIEEEFIPSIDVETGVHLNLTEEDSEELVIDEHHILDLTEVLRQYVVINGTGSGLCRPDCKGLCPMCGQNLNQGPCACDTARHDPRLAGLAQLLESQDHVDRADRKEPSINDSSTETQTFQGPYSPTS
jgi:uncharacterized protein